MDKIFLNKNFSKIILIIFGMILGAILVSFFSEDPEPSDFEKAINSNQLITLAWQPLPQKENNLPGVDILAPCWFYLADAQGNISVRERSFVPSEKYVKDAHKHKKNIWVLVTNDFNPDKTEQFLTNADAQNNFIEKILSLQKELRFDGVNLDFENIKLKNRDDLTKFVQNFTTKMHEKNILVSMDVNAPNGSDNWSRCYDHQALGNILDYVILMAYDQHPRLSKTAGSVASLDWVEKILNQTLKLVPKEKLMLGIPLYMRRWHENENHQVITQDTMTLTMNQAEKILQEKNVERVWQKKSGQFYFEYPDEMDGRYRVWQEDGNSITMKISLARKNQLAGVAFWRHGFESKEIWDLIHAQLK